MGAGSSCSREEEKRLKEENLWSAPYSAEKRKGGDKEKRCGGIPRQTAFRNKWGKGKKEKSSRRGGSMKERRPFRIRGEKRNHSEYVRSNLLEKERGTSRFTEFWGGQGTSRRWAKIGGLTQISPDIGRDT